MSQKPKVRAKRNTRVICRTTSESLRLFDCETVNTAVPTHVTDNLTQSKSSFVVTNVVSSAAIDSPEDESHSEEISRITDLETPSYSEETYSKDVDDEIIPGTVDIDENSVPFDVLLAAKSEQSSQSIHLHPFTLENQPSVIEVVTKEEAQITSPANILPGKIAEKDSIFVAQCNRSIGRFQVVKVESIEPFYRGRWTCHDYLDNSQHAPAKGWVFHQDRFIKKGENQTIPISPNIPESLPNNPNKQIPIQRQTSLELQNEAPAKVERSREAPSYIHTNTKTAQNTLITQQKYDQKSSPLNLPRNDRTHLPTTTQNNPRDDVYYNNQYNLISPEKSKSSLTTTRSLHGSIADTPPLTPNSDSLVQNIELNLAIPQVHESFLQTPPETPLSIVYQYRNKDKAPSEPVTPQISTPINRIHSSLPTLHIASRTYLPQNPKFETNPNRSNSSRRSIETVKEVKRQLSDDQADELIAQVETYLSGTKSFDGDKDYIIMVKRSSVGATCDNVVICREIEQRTNKQEDESVNGNDTINECKNEVNKGAIKKQLQISYSEPTIKECKNKMRRNLSDINSNLDNKINKIESIHSLEFQHLETCILEENEAGAVFELSITETPSSEDEVEICVNSISPEHFPANREWSADTDDITISIEDGENGKENLCLICDVSASLSFTVPLSRNSDEVER